METFSLKDKAIRLGVFLPVRILSLISVNKTEGHM